MLWRISGMYFFNYVNYILFSNSIYFYFSKRITKNDVSPELKSVLTTIYFIYAFSCIDKYIATFYQGEFAIGASFAEMIRSELLKRCEEIKNSAVSIADALAPPDWVLKSVLGKSDGRVSLLSYTLPTFWRFVNFVFIFNIPSSMKIFKQNLCRIQEQWNEHPGGRMLLLQNQNFNLSVY